MCTGIHIYIYKCIYIYVYIITGIDGFHRIDVMRVPWDSWDLINAESRSTDSGQPRLQ